MEDFLGYLDEWENEISMIPGLRQKEKAKLGLSRETLEGVRITGEWLQCM